VFVIIAAGTVGCDVPNLEDAACAASRTSIREFYSYHFGNEMAFSADGFGRRKRFLSPNLIESLSDSAEETDPFTTGTSELPRAFRVGACRQLSPERAEFRVMLLWRDEESSKQKIINVETERSGEQWLIDKLILNPNE
jgi:hypothetical protein